MGTDLVEILSRLEAELHQPAVRKNNGRVSELLHPDFEEFGRSGRRYTRDAVLAAMLRETETAVVIADLYAATELCPGVGLLTYRSALRQDDGSLKHHTLRSSVWVRVGDSWLLRFHQGTVVAE